MGGCAFMLLKNIKYVIVIFTVLVQIGCTNEIKIEHPHDELRVDIGNEPPTLDPTFSEDINSQRVLSDLFEGLVDYDQKNHVIRGMASSYTISDDGKTYTFNLRNDIKFSDGTPITSADVLFSWQRLIDPKNKTRYSFILDNVVNAESIINGKLPVTKLGVETPNEHTVIVHLINPDSSFLAKNTLTNLAIVSRANILKYGSKWIEPKNMVTSGAYHLVEHIPYEYILAEKNPYYYKVNNVAINKIRYYPYNDNHLAVAMYESHNLDTTFQNLPIDDYTRLAHDYGNQLYIVKQEAISFYEFNMKNKEIANNLKLRQALSLAVDRDDLTNHAFQDNKTALYSVVTSTVDDGKYRKAGYEWATWSADKRHQYAKKLYKEAGFSEKNPFRFTIMNDDNELYKNISLSLANMWKKNLGVDVYIDTQSWSTFLDNRHNGNYQVARGGWFADYNEVNTYLDNYMCNSPQNDMKWCNSDYDKLIRQADSETNSNRQTEIYKLAIKMAEDSYALIPLFQFSYVRLVKPYVKNYDIADNNLDRVQSKWFRF